MLRFILATLCAAPVQAAPPSEPVEIGNTPQLFVDHHIVDNAWTVKYRNQHIERIFHTPQKHEANPVVKLHGGYVCVARDHKSGVFHMWYQTHIAGVKEFVNAGYDHVYIHQIGPDQEGFFRFYERDVLPKLR